MTHSYKQITRVAVLFLFSIAIIQQNFGMENKEKNQNKNDLELFAEKYAPPKELIDYIKENRESLTEGDCFFQPH